jgi:CheY-like chemotaxis protein
MNPKHSRALIVEDDYLLAFGLEADMHTLGFEFCEIASNPREALTLAMNRQPDVVLMDVCLEGGREGIEAGRRLREICDSPVIFITSYNDEATVKRIHEQVPGAPVLSKPVYGPRLASAIASASAG